LASEGHCCCFAVGHDCSAGSYWFFEVDGAYGINDSALQRAAAGANTAVNISTAGTGGALLRYHSGLEVNLASATAATINQLRQSFQIQKLLERDARGGTRYTEMVLAHFGVRSPDARLQRPEYLGGGSSPIQINPIAQTAQTGLTGGSTPPWRARRDGHRVV